MFHCPFWESVISRKRIKLHSKEEVQIMLDATTRPHAVSTERNPKIATFMIYRLSHMLHAKTHTHTRCIWCYEHNNLSTFSMPAARRMECAASMRDACNRCVTAKTRL